MGRVVDQQQAPLRRERRQRLIVRRLAEEVRRDHRPGREPPVCRHAVDLRREVGGVHHAALFVYVDEDRRRPHQRHHARRRGKGEAGHEDRIARPDPLRHQRDLKSVGAARAGDSVGNARACGKRRLQLGHRRAEDEAAVLEHPRERGVDVRLEPPVLRAQVDEGDGVVIGR